MTPAEHALAVLSPLRGEVDARGPGSMSFDDMMERIAVQISAAVLEEREACAKVCEQKANDHGWNYHLPSVGRELAAAIRGRET